MLFLHSSRIYNLMRAELAGVWLDRSSNDSDLWMVAKLPMNLIRAIHAGAMVSLCAWVVEIEEKYIAAFGLQVDDNPQHPILFYGGCRSLEEVEDLSKLLTEGSFPLQIHNEVFLPVFCVACRFFPESARHVIQHLPSVGYPAESGFLLRKSALDVIQDSDSTFDPRIKVSCVLPLHFEQPQLINTHVIGSGRISLDDSIEGDELERLAFQVFDYLFPFGAFYRPQVQIGEKVRELCDILAISRIREVENEGIFLVECKVASSTTEGLKRTDERRGSSIRKNILKGIDQLKGAISRLKKGNRVFRQNGIDLDKDGPEVLGLVESLNLHERSHEIGCAIILISEMYEGIDWAELYSHLQTAFRETGYFFHILDLRELVRLVSNSNGRPAMLEGLLIRRWLTMAKGKTAFVRMEFKY